MLINKSTILFSELIVLVVVGLLYSFIPSTFNYKKNLPYGKNSLGQLANFSVTGSFNEIKLQENIKSVAAGFDHIGTIHKTAKDGEFTELQELLEGDDD